MNALVIGGNGFIGSHLVDRLLTGGHEVRVCDRRGELYRSPLATVDYVIGDFGNRALLTTALKNIEVVFHLACTTVPATGDRDPAYDVMSNVVGTIYLLENCVREGIDKIVLLSSGGAVYGVPAAVPVSEESRADPISSHGICKLTAEKYLALFHRMHGCEYVIVRGSNAYGPRQPWTGNHGVVSVMLGKVARGESVEIWGDGEAVKDYIYIEDLVEGVYRAAVCKTSSRIINLGSGVGRSVNDVVRIMRKVVKRRFGVVYVPAGAHDVPRIWLDIACAKRELDWAPASMDVGVEKTWEFVEALHR